ncbi:MAG: hypothetical protein A3F26_02950 [Candidatus Ryanbacteria bacterium RIFCSPHIGHO2_12_FULL_47_12b]|uniref:Uncharacterized protein n=3 Tax=Candidatus Ryaniibacteriota TaxID=1817914 RepID=A0A1G2H3N8_9BACT|nr:MAG: hypothetical protein UX74_C0012G0005 [Parcubacteria group bacterium GW2011_GWA2_47_10b]OGZ43298.1 MAG: hypothetical protein A2W41_01825 [Candidatus Ryanbacteria bacterium RIFCSPHIGHO2_01_45_13]OGZ52761.1 MAG: hypothetical protein A3F26_02950 [Candidatus Ryanbacteria bacterium RIFCSPHIGHO2_12_FULL_47_12b]OGZ56774.1 MAG: hypothetical protein A3J04_03050 [Candidatus Ryanbacteria bacterium RIFCSPLOWO2_02_FULL_47_14]OGZ56940.1 MAG: hypothetical protein A3G60_02170 [Candidatus Ryanbacteria ba
MNLLPENFKRELKHEAWRRFLVFFGTYVTLIEIVAITLLLPSFFFLRFQIDEFRKQRDAVLQGTDYRTMVDGKASVDSINRSVQLFNAFMESDHTMTPILSDVIARLPEDTFLGTFSLVRRAERKATLTLSGVAGHRDSLTQFVDRLEKSPFADGEADVPKDVFKKETDTVFTLVLPIK